MRFTELSAFTSENFYIYILTTATEFHCESWATHARSLTTPAKFSASMPIAAHPRHTSSTSRRTCAKESCYTLPREGSVKQHSAHLLHHLGQRVGDTGPGSRCCCVTTGTLPRLPSKGVLPPAATHNDRQKIVGAQSTSSVDESDPRCSTSAHARGGATNLAVVRMSSTHVAHSPAAASHTSRNHSCCSFSDRPDVFISSENRCSSCCWSSTYAEADVGYGRLQVA